MPSVLTPLLDTMSKGARTAWPFIQGLAAEGLNASEISVAMHMAGVPTFRNTDFLALVREATGAELLKSDIARFPSNSILPMSRIRTSLTKIVAPFSYTLRLIVLDKMTGESLTLTRQAHSDTLMSMEDIEAAFSEDVQGFERYAGMDIQSARVIDIQRAGSEGFL